MYIGKHLLSSLRSLYLHGDTVIEPSDTVDLMGIVIDDKLNFHQHVKKMISNAALKLNAL